MNEVTERILTETIERLETRVKQLESALRASESVSLDAALGPLRARQAILLFIGNGPADGFLDDVDRKMGAEIARALRDGFIKTVGLAAGYSSRSGNSRV